MLFTFHLNATTRAVRVLLNRECQIVDLVLKLKRRAAKAAAILVVNDRFVFLAWAGEFF